MSPDSLIQIEPNTAALNLPLVYDSPHSGSHYPEDFGYALDFQTLRRSEDAFVQELFAPVTQMGGTLLHALFPRCYIDPNRGLADVDVTMIEGRWDHPVEASIKLARGSGLIWKQVKKYGNIYDRLLTPEQVQTRIERCWQPYHDALAQLLDEAVGFGGGFIHVNCHSMASQGDHTTEDGPGTRPDFVLGDRDGTSCSAFVTDTVAQVLREAGYQVELNNPYKGLELIRKHSDPNRGRHSLQIEISRALYLDEVRVEKTAGFKPLQRDLAKVTKALASLAEQMLNDHRRRG